ncbi:hypothetical protein CBER1_09026 [Cercospora berteroae]|uniref:Uncharacterized protein n=1 Tax=Cercospora berteroae TaxID=357750 RepID=A0A2S6CC40_9PEZI|nr:hypothetical protein CBER1_09026 [Cercospora berteroae]
MATSTPPGDAATQITTTSPPPEYTGDAASRVFEITELLEHILLFAVASQSDQAKNKDSKVLKMPPMPGCGNVSEGGICLFSIQRVNGFLDFFVVRNWSEGKTLVTEMNKLFIDECASTYEQIIGQLPNGWHNPEASWRGIKICNAIEPSAFKYSFWSDLEDDDDAPPFSPSWQLGADVTLEYVFELYSIVLKVLDEYIPKKKLMNREVAIARDNAKSRWAGKELLHGRNNSAMLEELNRMFEQSIEDAFAMGREMDEVIASRTNEIGKGRRSC